MSMDDTRTTERILTDDYPDLNITATGNLTGYYLEPSFDQHLNSCVVIEGSNAVFKLVVSGCREGTVDFFINGTQVVDGQDNVTIAQANGHYQLTIQNCQIAKHKSVVWARATNDLGSTYSNGLLNVVPKNHEIMDQEPSTNNARDQTTLFNSTIVNMPTQFICSQCPMILNESERRQHISAEHLDYFPFGCPFCKKANKKYLENTEADMNQHILTCHSGNNLGIILLRDPAEEIKLNKMIDQCHRFRIQQVPSNDLKCEMLSGAGTLTENANAAQNIPALTEEEQESDNDDDVIIVEDVNERTAISNNSSDGNLSEQPTQEQAERIAEMEFNEPNEHSTANLIVDPENNEVPNTVLPEDEPFVNILITPNEPTAASVGSTINENTPDCANSEAPEAILPKTVPTVIISIAPDSHNFIESHMEMDYPNQSALSRKRQLPDNVSNDSVESREKRRLVMNDKQLESGGQCSHDVNRGNMPNEAVMNGVISQQNDQLRKPANSAQGVLEVPRDPAPKNKITKIWINIASGYAQFQSFGDNMTVRRPLHLPILCKSEADLHGCEVHIDFLLNGEVCIIPYRKKLETFLKQVRLISHLWKNGRVKANLAKYGKSNKQKLPISDLCEELFNGDSILASRELEIELHNDWPLSIVTNTAHLCQHIILKETRSPYQHLRYSFLAAIYDAEIPKGLKLTLKLYFRETAAKFANDLINRFENSTVATYFKFTVLFPCGLGSGRLAKPLRLKNKSAILEVTQRGKSDGLRSAVIEQRSIRESRNVFSSSDSESGEEPESGEDSEDQKSATSTSSEDD